MKNKKAFTLLEVLVSVAILVFVFLGFSSIFRTISSNQKSQSNDVVLLDDANYFLKVFKSSVIDAQIGDGVLCGIPDGKFFNTDGLTYVDFIKDGSCYSFDLVGGRILMTIDSTSDYITSKGVSIDSLVFSIEDDITLGQPIITVYLDMVKGDDFGGKISAQTSISLNYSNIVEEEVNGDNEWVELVYTLRDDDGTYYCADLTVSTASTTPILWQYFLDSTINPFRIDSIVNTWNMAYTFENNLLTMSGLHSWNETIVAGSPASGFGFCANRFEEVEEEWIELAYTIRDDNGASYCADLTVSTASTTPIVWDYDLDVSVDPFRVDTITSSWAMNYSLNLGTMSISGLEYNDEVVSGSPITELGFCANRSSGGGGDVTYDYRMDNDWGGGYCATIIVSTDSTTPIEWNIGVDLSTTPFNGTPSNVWNATWSFTSPTLYASGVGYNDYVSAGSPADFGYCANR
ncbi:MAG: cellulose binding domain-containing protein [Patescibacteria group bacterium]